MLITLTSIYNEQYITSVNAVEVYRMIFLKTDATEEVSRRQRLASVLNIENPLR